MTQPDQYFPDTAVNALSFADYAATPQEDWEEQIRGGVGSHFTIAEAAFDMLLNLVDQIPIIGPIISDVAELVLALFGVDVESGSSFDPGEVWMNTFNSFLAPLEPLLDLIKAPLNQLVELLVDVFDSIPVIGPPIGNAIEDLANLFGLLKESTDNAQSTADSAIQIIIAEGADIVDNFEREDDTDTMGGGWIENYGSGSGHRGIKNNKSHWYPASGASRFGKYRHPTALAGDDGAVKIVWASNIPNTSNPSEVYLTARVNTDYDDYLRVMWTRTTVEIGHVVNGVYTVLEDSLGQTTAEISGTAGAWEFQFVGYEFVLLKDSVEIHRVTDDLMASQKSAAHRGVGFMDDAGTGIGPFGVFYQATPPDVVTFTANVA